MSSAMPPNCTPMMIASIQEMDDVVEKEPSDFKGTLMGAAAIRALNTSSSSEEREESNPESFLQVEKSIFCLDIVFLRFLITRLVSAAGVDFFVQMFKTMGIGQR